MTEHLDDIRAAVGDVVAGIGAERHPDGDLDLAAWTALDELGFTNLTVPVELGGAGGDVCDAAAVVEAAARVSAPLAEALFLAGPLLAAADLPWPNVVTTAAIGDCVAVEKGTAITVSGHVTRVPWLRSAHRLVLLAPDARRPVVAVLDPCATGVGISAGTNLAGEHRDNLYLDAVTPLAVAPVGREWDMRRGHECAAVGRINQMAGAARRTLGLTVTHVHQRVQFGRPLVKFQAVQQLLARLAADVTLVRTAAAAAAKALRDRPANAAAVIAAAKVEASATARSITATSHQLSGAVGFSQEYLLGAYTRRLWAWREEYGNETVWQQRLSDLIADNAGDLWALVTDTAATSSP